MIANLDSGSAAAIQANAKSQGIVSIDYDRLTLNGDAAYYVSFDNVAVGKLQGEGLAQAIKDWNVKSPVIFELGGSPTDNNATLFEQGYDSVLQPLYDAKTGDPREPHPRSELGQPAGRHDVRAGLQANPASTPCSRPMTASASRRSRS